MRKVFLIIFISVIVISYFVINNVLPYSPIKPYRVNVKNLVEFKSGSLPSDFGLSYFPLNIKTKDSLSLSAYYIKAVEPKASVILLHGIADCKEHYYAFCKKLVSIHCNCVIVDSRAHGQSEGTYCTFGAKEKYDISQLVDSIFYNFNDSLIGIFGSSLGGAIAKQTTAINNKIKFAIIESTFNSLENVINEYFKDLTGFKYKKLVHHILKKSGDIANFDPFNVIPENDCSLITCPVLFAHGSKDNKIPIEFNKENFEKLSSLNKSFITVEGAGHFDLHQIGGVSYWNKLQEFIISQMPR